MTYPQTTEQIERYVKGLEGENLWHAKEHHKQIMEHAKQNLSDIRQQISQLRALEEKLSTEVLFEISILSALRNKRAGQPFQSAPCKDRVFVTDHAIVRYIERVEGRNMQALISKIMSVIPENIPAKAEVVKTGKIAYRLAREGRNITICTIVKSGGFR